jgi:guanylate kinase
MNERGRLFVLAGPSGAGKGTIIARALRTASRVVPSVSVTTRPPRPAERDGVHYRFISEEDFRSLAEQGELLEWAEVHGHLYGTPRGPVATALDEGRDVLLELDVRGAAQVKEAIPEAVLIFVEPPSFEDLVTRLEARGTEDPARQAQRIEAAYEEIKAKGTFDHVIVNDDPETAASSLVRILDGGSNDATRED